MDKCPERKMKTSIMKIKSWLACLVIAVLLASCSAEIVSSLPPEDVADSSATVEIISRGADNLTISFDPVPYAKSYWYTVGDSVDYTACDITVDGDRLTTVIDVASQTTGYFVLYGSTATSADDTGFTTVPVATVDYTLSLANVDISGYAYVSARTKDGVLIGFKNNIDTTQAKFRADFDLNDQLPGIVIENPSELEIPLEAPNQSYTLYLFWALADEEFNSEMYATLEVGQYDSSLVADMRLTATDDGFKITEIPGNVSTIDLRKSITGDSTEYETLVTVAVSGGESFVPFSNLQSLETGSFYAATGDGVISNIMIYTVPVTELSRTENWKSAEIGVNFDDPDYVQSLSVIGQANVTAYVSDSKDSIVIEGLDSNSTYNRITVRVNGDSNLDFYIEDVNTRSFAEVGVFKWEGTFVASDEKRNFVILVENAPEGSDFPYYVYFDDTDDEVVYQKVTGQKLRIMPLIDSSAGLPESIREPESSSRAGAVDFETGMAGTTNFVSQNNAYRINSVKWNSLAERSFDSYYLPSKWYIPKPADTNDAKDVVSTITSSFAIILWAETSTTFEFGERFVDGIAQPYVRFENKSDNSLVKSGLQQNASPQNVEFGDMTMSSEDAKYNWYLTPASEEV